MKSRPSNCYGHLGLMQHGYKTRVASLLSPQRVHRRTPHQSATFCPEQIPVNYSTSVQYNTAQQSRFQPSITHKSRRVSITVNGVVTPGEKQQNRSPSRGCHAPATVRPVASEIAVRKRRKRETNDSCTTLRLRE